MPRVIVKEEANGRVLMNERVDPVHLEDEHSSLQLLERLAWAIEEGRNREIQARARRRRVPPRLVP